MLATVCFWFVVTAMALPQLILLAMADVPRPADTAAPNAVQEA